MEEIKQKILVDIVYKDYGDGETKTITVEELDEAIRNCLDNSGIGQYMIDVDDLPDEKDIEKLKLENDVLKMLNKKDEKK